MSINELKRAGLSVQTRNEMELMHYVINGVELTT